MTNFSSTYPWRMGARASLVLAFFLAGCSAAPEKTEPVEPTGGASSTLTTPGYTLSMPRSTWEAQFVAAETALARTDWMSADVALADLKGEPLSPVDNDRLIYLEARMAHLRGDQALARSQLDSIDKPGLHPALAYRVYNFKRHLLGLSGDFLGSAKLGAALLQSAPQADRTALKRSVWHDLQRLDSGTLETAAAQTNDPDWAGWLALSALANRDISQLVVELPAWVASNPGHPAANPLPGGLQYLEQSPRQLDRVALLLPLSGRLAPAGKAVRDGYLAAYYRSMGTGTAPAELMVIDSDRYSSATEAYLEAVSGGAKLVIGPLSKSAVADIAKASTRSVPILALNQVDGELPLSTSALVQFSLAPEDEAAQIAEMAFGSGARRALILRPEGAWGSKMDLALRKSWEALGGSTADIASFTGQDDYSAGVKAGLGIAASEQRRRQVRDMLATNVEFTPRRRQDLDVVFMLARNGPEARALKPLLAFHYAGALPVYATSSAYSGVPDARDKDLDDLNLVDLPWLLGSNPELKGAIGADKDNRYPRLNALGADAYRLQSRFVQFQAGPDALLKGDTGLLTMNPQLQIQRELEAARFDGAQLRVAR